MGVLLWVPTRCTLPPTNDQRTNAATFLSFLFCPCPVLLSTVVLLFVCSLYQCWLLFSPRSATVMMIEMARSLPWNDDLSLTRTAELTEELSLYHFFLVVCPVPVLIRGYIPRHSHRRAPRLLTFLPILRAPAHGSPRCVLSVDDQGISTAVGAPADW